MASEVSVWNEQVLLYNQILFIKELKEICLVMGYICIVHNAVMRRAGEVYEQTVKEVGYCKAGQAFITDGKSYCLLTY